MNTPEPEPSKRRRYRVLACDYDGTLARHGEMDPGAVAALERVRASGRELLLVTGRELPDLERACPALGLFSFIVAENGAVLYDCKERDVHVLGDPPPPGLVQGLHRAGVSVSVGRSIVATWEPNQGVVFELIHSLGLEHQVVFNKGAVMVLPPGVNKRTGLVAALERLGLSAHECVGVGDAENDHAFLLACECAV